MSDNPLLAFAIGSLAASQGANELARLSASIMVPLPVRAPTPNVNIYAMIEALQEQEQHIARQDELIANLQKSNAEWQGYGDRMKAALTKLECWADGAEEELRHYRNKP